MSTQNEPAPIENAEAIIERFGGIRPMATKINVPVTTVQGWKKRNVIPGARRAEILAAAQQLGMDLSDIISTQPQATIKVVPAAAKPSANENDRPDFARPVNEAPRVIVPPSGADAPPLHLGASLETQITRAEQKAVVLSTMINVLLVLLAVGSVVLMLVPQNKRLAALEGDIQGLEKKQSFLTSLIPGDIQAQIDALRSQFTRLDNSFGSALGKAQSAANDMSGPGSLSQRVSRLEGHVNGMANDFGMSMPAMPTSLHSLVSKLEAMSTSLGGQEQLNAATSQLASLLAGVPQGDQTAVEQTLQSAAQEDPQLAQTFAGVQEKDMKAAALLLGLTQFRSTLNRSNQPFAEDLALLKKLVGDQDPELQASIDRLAPYAEEGVLTPDGLTQEFKGIAGDVVVASLQGEDVSIADKAQARLGDMFQIEKDGQQINGTPTQKTLANTDKLLQSGDIEGALAQMQTLDGPAAIAAQPWISKAQATVLAHKFKNLLTQSIGNNGYGGGVAVIPGARGLNLPGSPASLTPNQSNVPIYNQH